jgi:multiple sugar transport system ATP-binding protein
VAILRDGRLEQVDAPQVLYDRPATLFVGSFIGSPAMNLLRGRVVEGGLLQLGSSRLSLPAGRVELRGDVVVGIRPEALEPCPPERAEALDGEVVLVESLGSDVLAHVEVEAPAVLVGEQLDAARELHGGNGALPERARLTARLPPSVPVETGAPLRLGVDPAGIHLFDPHTERAL